VIRQARELDDAPEAGFHPSGRARVASAANG
jgi:hypothetical protein